MPCTQYLERKLLESWLFLIYLTKVLASQQVEVTARPLVGVYVVGIYMPHQDPVVIVVQVIASKDVELPMDCSHGVVDPSLQHGAAAYPLILEKEIQVNSVNSREPLCLVSSGDLMFVNHLLFKCCSYTLKGMGFFPENKGRGTHIFQLYFSNHIRHFLLFGLHFIGHFSFVREGYENIEIERIYLCKLPESESARLSILTKVV